MYTLYNTIVMYAKYECYVTAHSAHLQAIPLLPSQYQQNMATVS
jgi:hypothetical protein